MSLRIGLTGPHGSGKTTLLNDLRALNLDITFLPEITRVIKDKGFVINEHGSRDTQLLVLTTHIQNLLYNDRFIVDRCLIDGCLYTEYLYTRGQVSRWVRDFGWDLCHEYLSMYDYIFYLPPEWDLPADGVRSNDREFYESIKRLFDNNIPSFKRYTNIVTTIGTREQRVSTIIQTIQEKI